MSLTMQERLRMQREAAARTGAVADDALGQAQQKKTDNSQLVTSAPAASPTVPVTGAPSAITTTAVSTAPPAAAAPAGPAPPPATASLSVPAAATRTQGIPISPADDALLAAMEAYCRTRGIKMRRTSNVSLLTRAGWRLLHELMQHDPEAFALAIERGRPPGTPH